MISSGLRLGGSACIVPLKIEYGSGYIIMGCPYSPYSIYLRGTVGFGRGFRV